MKTNLGAQGSTLEGSPWLVYLDSVKQAALDEETARYGGVTKGIYYKQQAKIDRYSLLGGLVGAV